MAISDKRNSRVFECDYEDIGIRNNSYVVTNGNIENVESDGPLCFWESFLELPSPNITTGTTLLSILNIDNLIVPNDTYGLVPFKRPIFVDEIGIQLIPSGNMDEVQLDAGVLWLNPSEIDVDTWYGTCGYYQACIYFDPTISAQTVLGNLRVTTPVRIWTGGNSSRTWQAGDIVHGLTSNARLQITTVISQTYANGIWLDTSNMFIPAEEFEIEGQRLMNGDWGVINCDLYDSSSRVSNFQTRIFIDDIITGATSGAQMQVKFATTDSFSGFMLNAGTFIDEDITVTRDGSPAILSMENVVFTRLFDTVVDDFTYMGIPTEDPTIAQPGVDRYVNLNSDVSHQPLGKGPNALVAFATVDGAAIEANCNRILQPVLTNTGKNTYTYRPPKDTFIIEPNHAIAIQAVGLHTPPVAYAMRATDDTLGPDHAIIGVNQPGQQFRVAGNVTAEILIADTIRVTGSTGNDGDYTVTFTNYTGGLDYTDITVAEALSSMVADGTINRVIAEGDLEPVPVPASGTVKIAAWIRFRQPMTNEQEYVLLNRTDIV